MKTILLIRESEFQRYCANTLFLARVLDQVIVEDGASLPREEAITVGAVGLIMRAGLSDVRKDPIFGPRRAVVRLRNLFNRRKYWGYRDFHQQRILTNYRAFEAGLPVIRVEDINNPEAHSVLQETKPDLVFVHGTRLIRKEVFEAIRARFVNLHWGWSPNYRGDGIVPALALEGPSALGVTVHLIDEGIDTGDILYQARPKADALDNFYSIGLKLTVLGTDLFLRVAEDYSKDHKLVGRRQIKHKSQLFSSKYMHAHPELYPRAWRNLNNLGV